MEMKEEIQSQKIFLGKVVGINFEDWIIDFSVPTWFDENNKIFPKALPIFNHNTEIMIDDTVVIIKHSEINNELYYYLPLTIYRKVGMFFNNNIVDLTNEGLINILTKKIQYTVVNEINYNCPIITISNSENPCSLNINGNISQTGNSNITGSLITSTELGCNSYYTGQVIVNTQTLTFNKGCLVSVT